MPMWQAEAMWIHFGTRYDYPFAVKIAAGKINAVCGENWRDGLHRDPQDYVVVPRQPWLDGFSVEARLDPAIRRGAARTRASPPRSS